MRKKDPPKLERKIVFTPAYDRRSEGYGTHPVEITFVLKGPRGVITFGVCTGMHVRSVRKEFSTSDLHGLYPYSPGINYHAHEPQYENQTQIKECPYLDNKPCYCDGSSLAGDELMDEFIFRGEDAVWPELEKWYESRFGG